MSGYDEKLIVSGPIWHNNLTNVFSLNLVYEKEMVMHYDEFIKYLW